MYRILSFLVLITFAFLFQSANAQQINRDTLRVMVYNLLNYPDGRNDCSNNTLVTNKVDTLRKIVEYVNPDIFGACEVQHKRGADSVLTRALNVNGITKYKMAPWQTSVGGAGYSNSIIYYNSEKLTLLYADAIQTGVRDIPHYVFYANDPNLSNLFDTTYFEVLVCHLKAGSGADDVAQRGSQSEIIRSFIDSRPLNRNYVLMGDLNTYKSSEICYQKLTTGGLNPFKDPINRPGNWNNSSSFRDVHTQSTRSYGNYDCGSTGGLDDRFDQIILTNNMLQTGNRVQYLTGSYKAIGNDGNHFNQSINNGTNSEYPPYLTRALFYMSDHLPVVLNLEVEYPTENGLALLPSWGGVDCYGSSTGWAKVIPHAGQAPYTYDWGVNTNNQTTQTATNLPAGQYCVIVTDALGQVDNYCVTIPENSEIETSAFTLSDNGTCNGSINVLATGGTLPFTYSWSHDLNLTTTYINNVCAGTYTCTITDAKGCTKQISITIDEQLSVDSIENLKFEYYPNPIENILTLKSHSNFIEKFEILDLSGKSILIFELKPFSENVIDLSTYESGVYFLKMFNSNRLEKMIKL